MPRFQILQENLSTLPFWLMEPRPELAAGGPCLAIPGDVYALLAQRSPRQDGSAAPRIAPVQAAASPAPAPARPRENNGANRELAVNLNALRGPATAQWINIWSGEKSEMPIAGPGVYQFNRPASFGDAPGLLIVRARR